MYKILIVDDEELERTALRHMLGKDLPELEIIAEARNGIEAVEMAKEYEPDIILMDIKMPGKSGLEAAEEINVINPATKIIMLTAFDRFEYAQSALKVGAVEYLLKPIRSIELKNVLKKCIVDFDNQKDLDVESAKKQLARLLPYLETSLVYDLINGNITLEDELNQRISILGIDLIPGIVMIVEIERVLNQSNSQFECQFTRQKIFEILQNVFADNKSILITPIMANKFVILIPCSNNMYNKHYEYCYKKAQIFIEKIKGNTICSIGLGNYYEDISSIRQSYLEALTAQRESAFACKSEIISYNKMKKDNNKTIFINVHESQLLKLIYSEDWNKTNEYIETWLNNIRSSNLGVDLQKACVLELLIFLYHEVFVTELDRQSFAVLNLNKIINLINSNTIDDLENSFNQTVQEMIDKIKDRRDDTVASMVNITRSFINANFSKDISLDDVANYVHVSPCYLSRMFSKEVGMPFKKYLVNAKIKHAKKLLLTTTKPVNEIGTEVGYQDTSYFCRIFKNEEGLPPNEFRTKYKQADQLS